MKKQLTEAQRAQAEQRRALFRELVKKLAAMPAEKRAEMAAGLAVITCEGHALSVRNTCLVAFQYPAATMVGGFRQWLKHGRAVRKGERGISIWIPSTAGGGGGAPGEAKGEAGDSGEGEDVFFLMGTVFDVGQTDLVQGGAQ